jgi:hypothetical protein
VNRHRALGLAFAFGVALALIAATSSASSSGSDSSATFDAKQYKLEHGYLPLRGVATLEQAKRHADEEAASMHPARIAAPAVPAASVGSSWAGMAQQNLSPPDPNGAIGPNSYIEIVNRKIAIYTRIGVAITSATLKALTGRNKDADPMILWDPDTQRFYYNVLNVANAKMDWGFSKDANPATIPGSFCRYETAFGYATTSVPDYPKLGQTKDFLLIGVNFYPTNSSQSSTSSDVLWISKPQGADPVTTCPAASSFGSGKFTGLLNADSSRAYTPTPAIQTDPSSTGYVATMSDLECPPNCGATGTTLSVFAVTPSGGGAQISGPTSITVGSFQTPPDAPQPGTSNKLDTLDGRITHAVSGFDPTIGATTVWTAHTVLGGAGSEIRWYEVDPAGATVVQTGAATSASVRVFNAGISNDRTCTATQCAHGDSMAVGFTTSSGSSFPAIRMVTKTGGDPQSGFVLIKQSAVSDTGFTCSPCRWGDYGGATPDPAASLTALHGAVWLSNQWTKGGKNGPVKQTSGDATWNWEVQL